VQVEAEAEVEAALKRPTGGTNGDMDDAEKGEAPALHGTERTRGELREGERKSCTERKGAKVMEKEGHGREDEQTGGAGVQAYLCRLHGVKRVSGRPERNSRRNPEAIRREDLSQTVRHEEDQTKRELNPFGNERSRFIFSDDHDIEMDASCGSGDYSVGNERI
jgi:hypothetical protein